MKANALVSFIVIIASSFLGGCASHTKFGIKVSDGVVTTTAFGKTFESGYTEKSSIWVEGRPGLSFKVKVEFLKWTRHNPLLDPWGCDGWVPTGIVREFASEVGRGYLIKGLPLVVDNESLRVTATFYDESGNFAGSDSTAFPSPWDHYHYQWHPYPRQ